MTSFDMSAVLRQGGFIVLGNPRRAAKILLDPKFKAALKSDEGQHALNSEIMARDNALNYERDKLFLADQFGKLSAQEEAYMGQTWADKVPGVKWSQRAYVTFLNRLRADTYDALTETLKKGREVTPEEGRAIAEFINVATGRGKLPDNAAVMLNRVFFAPRYVAIRFQLLSGTPLYRGTARTRGLIAKEYAKYLSGIAVLYGLGTLAGGEVTLDPRSKDFGKMRFGNTRIDPLSGLAQSTVLLGRMITGEQVDKYGRAVPMHGDVPFGQRVLETEAARFMRSKLAPYPGAVADVVFREDMLGRPVNVVDLPARLTLPLVGRDIFNALIEQGIPAAIAMSMLGFLAMGVNTYDPYFEKP